MLWSYVPKRLGVLLVAFCMAGSSLLLPASAAQSAESGMLAETIINSDIAVDTTWTLSQSPYYVTASIYIEPGVTLTIEPGVTVLMGENKKIHVGREGIGGATIVAKGTPSQPITFDRHDTWYRWKTIRHYAGSSSYYRYVRFYWGGEEEATLYYAGSGSHVLNNCEIKKSNKHGIYATDGTSLRIAGTLITENKQRSVTTDGGTSVDITGSNLTTNDTVCVYLRSSGASSTITVANSTLVSGTSFGAFNERPGTVCIDARNNWWGSALGPQDASATSDKCGLGTNWSGATDVSDGVNYTSWLSSKPARVGITTPPVVALAVTPDPAIPLTAGTVFTFTAAASSDVEDYTPSLQFCWDWDGDGSGCDATTMTATTTFPGGLNTVLLTVTDTDGLTDTVTQQIVAGPPTASFVYTQTSWAEADFDASTSSDVEDPVSSLLARWDWEGDGLLDTGTFSVTQIVSHTYPHLGRFWPGLMVQDTDGLTDTVSRAIDVIPPAASATITGGGGALGSIDGTVVTAIYTDTVDSASIGAGLTITHTPWLTVPHAGLQGDFTYWGFNLAAESGGQPVSQVTGTYTITVYYVYTYFNDVVGLAPFEGQLTLYHWSGVSWTPVDFTLDTTNDWLVATMSSFGDFALVMDVKKVYLPMVFKSY